MNPLLQHPADTISSLEIGQVTTTPWSRPASIRGAAANTRFVANLAQRSPAPLVQWFISRHTYFLVDQAARRSGRSAAGLSLLSRAARSRRVNVHANGWAIAS